MKSVAKVALLVVMAGLTLSSLAPASTIVADSVSGFSGTQGTNGWYYGYTTDGTTFTQLTSYTIWGPPYNYFWYGTNNGFDYTSIGADWQSPGGSGYSVVREWKSAVSGTVDIAVDLAKIEADSSSDGGIAYIYVDGIKKWEQAIDGTDTTGYQTTVSGLTVAAGSKVDFVLYPNATGNMDMTKYTATISLVPEPISLVLIGLGGLMLHRKNR